MRRAPWNLLVRELQTSVRMSLLTDFAHRTSIMTHMTYLISNRRAIAFALGHVRQTLVTNHTVPRQIPLQKSNKTTVRMRLPTVFAHHASVVAHMTYLISNRQAVACALGHVRLTLVTNTPGAKTDSTAKEQQNECENALVD